MAHSERKLHLDQAIHHALETTTVTDLHTHLYAPAFGSLLLWGIDELLNHHYLIAEALRWGEISPDEFYGLGLKQQADFIWKTLFIDHSPVSASGIGVLDTLNAFGLDTSARDLDSYRSYFASQDLNQHIDKTFASVGIQSCVMTNDPFDDAERPVWMADYKPDPRFHAALRLDALTNMWDDNYSKLRDMGYDVELNLGGNTMNEIKRFLTDWVERIDALYMAVSLPPTYAFPEANVTNRLIEECCLPVAEAKGIPFALMIGVRRQVNAAYRLAGDAVGKADVGSVEKLCSKYPNIKFLVTMLSRENQYELCVAARKFPNLMIFGCWWFLNIPYLIDEMTRMRIELLGTAVIPHHSDVRIMEQVIPKWLHAKHITADVLYDKYSALEDAGWKVRDEEIQRDVEDMFHRNFWRFLGKL